MGGAWPPKMGRETIYIQCSQPRDAPAASHNEGVPSQRLVKVDQGSSRLIKAECFGIPGDATAEAAAAAAAAAAAQAVPAAAETPPREGAAALAATVGASCPCQARGEVQTRKVPRGLETEAETETESRALHHLDLHLDLGTGSREGHHRCIATLACAPGATPIHASFPSDICTYNCNNTQTYAYTHAVGHTCIHPQLQHPCRPTSLRIHKVQCVKCVKGGHTPTAQRKSHAMSCHFMPCHITPSRVKSRHATSCHVTPRHVFQHHPLSHQGRPGRRREHTGPAATTGAAPCGMMRHEQEQSTHGGPVRHGTVRQQTTKEGRGDLDLASTAVSWRVAFFAGVTRGPPKSVRRGRGGENSPTNTRRTKKII